MCRCKPITENFDIHKITALILLVALSATAHAAAKSPAEVNAVTLAVRPRLLRPVEISYRFEAASGSYLNAISENWLKVAPGRNPGILGMFANRDKDQNLLAWSGEFAGKYLTAAVQVLRLTQDKQLRNYLQNFVDRLIALQAEDGYLGPWPKPLQLSPKNHVWDAWGHYHIMVGLLFWYEQTNDSNALAAAGKIGDLLCEKFLGRPGSLAALGWPEMNLAPAHSLTLLYEKTGKIRYLQLARQIIEEELPKAGDYLNAALTGKEFYQSNAIEMKPSPIPRVAGINPRWESLHTIMALPELYWLTGDERYSRAFEHIWWSIAEFDRHNTGGFSSAEKAGGNPYAAGAIETCCTVAWAALSVEMLKMTGNSVVADELELTLTNAIYGYQSRDGSWCTYDTPMNGRRIPTTISLAFQKRPGTEELSCCSVNAARGFGLLSDWALMQHDNSIILNWYGPSLMSTRVNGVDVTLRQQTDYPRTGNIRLDIAPAQPTTFTLKLRIPHWSQDTFAAVNGKPLPKITPGRYLQLTRKWKKGDRIEIQLDMSLHFWVGQNRFQGRSSIYRGPVLLAYNPKNDPENIHFSEHWKQFGRLYCSRDIGATLSYTFTGTTIRWFGNRFDDAGVARVEIDGKEVDVVDQYGPGRELPFSRQYDRLKPGRHTIELTIIDDKNHRSKDYWVNIAAFSQPDDDPRLDAAKMNPRLIQPRRPAIVAVECTDTNGNAVRLCDFDSAGQSNRYYISWLKVVNAPDVPFSRSNPRRSAAAHSHLGGIR